MVPTPIFIVDAFSEVPFGGNPAAVCILQEPLDDGTLQRIAAELNLSETAFVAPDPSGVASYGLRWFTPTVEVPLCGHATLAAAAVLFAERGFAGSQVVFATRSGPLTVAHGSPAGELVMDLPAFTTRPSQAPELRALPALLGIPAGAEVACFEAAGFALLRVGEDVALEELRPDFSALRRAPLHPGGDELIVTRRGPAPYHFTSRMFAPWIGIDEDPVTGAAHAVLGPYWGRELGEHELRARQVSRRGGDVGVRVEGDRVKLTGFARIVMRGTLSI